MFKLQTYCGDGENIWETVQYLQASLERPKHPLAAVRRRKKLPLHRSYECRCEQILSANPKQQTKEHIAS